MRHSVSRTVLTLWFLGSIAGVDAPAQTPTEPAAEALARPISPGSVALLLPHASQPAAIERLKQALADPRPEVRAVAARIVFTTRHQALAAALTAALETEQSPVVGTEIVRALTLIRGVAGDAAIRAALPRFDSRATAAWVQTVVRARPGDLWRQVTELPDVATHAQAQALFEAAVAQPEAAGKAFASLRSTPALEPAYLAILRHAFVASKLPPWPVMAAGLDAPGPPRQHAALHLLWIEASGAALPPEAAAALRDLPAAADLAWMPVYAELLRRYADPKTPPRSLVAQIGKIDPASVPEGLRTAFVTTRFDQSEVAAFRRVAGPDWAPPDVPPGVDIGPVRRSVASNAAATPPAYVTRLARPMSVALMRDLGTLLKCKLAPGQFGLIDVQYRPTGQVRAVSPAVGGPSGCLQLTSVVAALEVAPGDQRVPDDRADRLLVSLRPGDLSCERFTPVLEAQATRPGAKFTPPKKTRMVEAVYPEAARQAKIQGVVIIEATIPTSGCIAEARVLRSVPGLDEAAIAAVSEWLYEPPRIDGKPTPVIMTVTINFQLK